MDYDLFLINHFMKKIFFIVFMSATILACTSADNKTGSSTTTTTDTLNKEEITARIKGIEEDWNKANLGADHSYKFSEDILADDFLGHNDKAVMQNKEEYLKDLAAANYTVTNITNGPMFVTVYAANFAVIVGSHHMNGKDKEGVDFSGTFSWTDTFMERNGKWQLIASAVISTDDKK